MKAAVSANWPRGTGFAADDIAPHDDPRAAGDLGHQLGPEAVQDLVEGALDRREGRQMLGDPVAAFEGFREMTGFPSTS